jgi:hypothetical protein
MDPDRPPATDSVADRDPGAAALGGGPVYGRLELASKFPGAIVEAAFEEFRAGLDAELLGQMVDVNRQDAARDHVNPV